MDTIELVKTALKVLDDKMAEDVKVLDIRGISVMSDYFVIASAKNVSQVKAIADELEQKIYENGGKLVQSEGYQSARWVLLDFNDIIVHIFLKEEREFYQLERVWADAKQVDIDFN